MGERFKMFRGIAVPSTL